MAVSLFTAAEHHAADERADIRFDHVQIPRSALLSRFAQVAADGTYTMPPHAKLSYGGVSELASRQSSLLTL